MQVLSLVWSAARAGHSAHILTRTVPYEKVGEIVQLAYVDQGRILDGTKTAYQELSEGRDEITVGNREINARAYQSGLPDGLYDGFAAET